MATQIPPMPGVEVYAAFSGPIDQNVTQRFFQAVALASANNVRHIHLLLESFGGVVGDAVALYSFFRTLPIGLTVYNSGTVQSSAVIAYLGANERKVSARASFMIHGAFTPEKSATAGVLHAMAKSIQIDNDRMEAILRQHITLSPEEWECFGHYDIHLSADDAVRIGLAQEIGEFSPPQGAKLYAI